MGDQIIYLEKYIENSGVMPPELTRILNTIKDLDERSEDLAAQIQDNFQALMSAPPGPPRKGQSDTVAELRARMQADQTLLIQFAEEKVQLATTGHDLVFQQLTMLDADIDALERELHVSLNGMVDDYDMPMDEPVPVRGGGRASRLQYAPSMEGLATMPSIDVRPSRKANAMSLSREPSAGFGSEMGYGTGSDLGWDAPLPTGNNGSNKRASQKRAGPGPVVAAAAAAGLANEAAAYQPKRRAAQAAAAATAAVAALENDDGTGAVAAPAAAAPAYAAELLPGMSHASPQPQAPGRLLTAEDIGDQLIGLHAEVYWPDEQLWYLVRIHAIDTTSRTASIIYSTGEAESLNLDDICRDGHMSLIER